MSPKAGSGCKGNDRWQPKYQRTPEKLSSAWSMSIGKTDAQVEALMLRLGGITTPGRFPASRLCAAGPRHFVLLQQVMTPC